MSCAVHAGEPTAEWTLADLFTVLVRRRGWILAALAVSCALALVYGLGATRRYRAQAEIEVQKESQGAFGLENTTNDKESAAVTDTFDLNLTLQTESSVLQSDSLALDVIRRAGLETAPDYFAPQRSRFPWRRRIYFWRKPLEPLSTPLAEAPNRRYVALKTFGKHLKVTPVAGTRIIRVAYSDPDPARAAAVANDLVQALADYTYQSRSSAAAQSAGWLASQLAGLKQQAEALDARAAALQGATGSYGEDASHNVVLARLDELNGQLAAAESSRIVREAVWRAVQTGDPEVISGLSGTAPGSMNTQNSFALLQSLRAQETTAKAQLAESANRYGENWPAVAEQRARLGTIQKSIQDEIHRLSDRAHSDYQIALQSENSAREAFDQQKGLAARTTGSAVAWRLARQEADESRALYTNLLGRLQQTGVLEGLHSGNFTVVSPARVPPPDHPSSPNLPLLAAVAVAGGSLLGSAAAIARELSDHTIHSAAELEALVDTPVFAVLPAQASDHGRFASAWIESSWLQSSWLARLLPLPRALALEAAAGSDYALPAPESSYAEALHCLRASLLLAHSGRAPQVILVAAPRPEMGKNEAARGPARSYTEDERPSLALNLAAVLAQHGSATLYVDADLRAAARAGVFPSEAGLSDLLTSEGAPEFEHSGQALLSVIHTGPRPPSPSELIASPRMETLLARWREEFSFLVINGPAAVYADALVLAQMADAVLLTVQAGRTRDSEVAPAFHAFSRQVAEHAVLGVILEGAREGAAYARA